MMAGFESRRNCDILINKKAGKKNEKVKMTHTKFEPFSSTFARILLKQIMYMNSYFKQNLHTIPILFLKALINYSFFNCKPVRTKFSNRVGDLCIYLYNCITNCCNCSTPNYLSVCSVHPVKILTNRKVAFMMVEIN